MSEVEDKAEELIELIHAWMHVRAGDCLPFAILVVEEPTLHVFGRDLNEADVRYCMQRYLALGGRPGDQPPVHQHGRPADRLGPFLAGALAAAAGVRRGRA